MTALILALSLFLVPSALECPEAEALPPGDQASLEQLRMAFDACPWYTSSRDGAIALRFADALDGADRPSEAIEALAHGLASMEAVDAATADRFVHLVYREQDYDRYDAAAEQYLALIGTIDESDTMDDVLRQQLLDEITPILPPDIRQAFGLEEDDRTVNLDRLPDDAGARLVTFWRRADILPATTRNERLVEHLSRTAEVRVNYVAADGRIDDRGRTYLRYGEPLRRAPITAETGTSFSAARMHRQRERVGVLPELEVAENELWVYTNVHRSAHFLFVFDDREKRFRHGSASELLPRTWAGSLRRTDDFLHLMEYLYRQLSLNHADYGLLYTDVANYNQMLRSGQPQAVPVPPRSFAASAFSESQSLDYQIEQYQRDGLPSEHTNVREDVERLPVEARIARFLGQGGGTRAEIYWGTSVEALFPDRRSRRDLRRAGIEESGGDLRFMLTKTAVQQDVAYEPLDRSVRRYNLGPFGDERGLLAPGAMELAEVEQPFRLALQWDLLTYESDGTIGPLVKFQTDTYELIEPLDASGGRFEVSDLKPMVLASDGIPLDIDDEARIYPFRRVGAEAQLALVFEVYNLVPDDNGQSRYSVEYSVAREREGLLRRVLPGGGRADETSARAEFVADGVSDYAFIVVDLTAWDASGPVELRLTFADETTGASVERRIDFDVSSRVSSGRTATAVD